MSDHPPTIRDVAARAGVSKSLVSLFLQGGNGVGDKRRAAIETAIDELGYRPNASARILSQSRTRTIGILLNDLRNPWFVDLLEEAAVVLHASGFSPLLVDSQIEARSGRDPADVFLDQRVEGFLVVGTTPDPEVVRRVSLEIPTVLAGTSEPRLDRVDVVDGDDEVGGRLATEHLIELGHERIALLEGPGLTGARRRAGYETEMRARGLGHRILVAPTDMTEQGGHSGALALLRGAERPSAIVAFNDVSAVGTLSVAQELGLRVPDDLSVVGYDDTFLARIRHLSLTSLDNHNAEVGRLAAELLVGRMQTPTLEARSLSVTPELRRRTSTAAFHAEVGM